MKKIMLLVLSGMLFSMNAEYPDRGSLWDALCKDRGTSECYTDGNIYHIRTALIAASVASGIYVAYKFLFKKIKSKPFKIGASLLAGSALGGIVMYPVLGPVIGYPLDYFFYRS